MSSEEPGGLQLATEPLPSDPSLQDGDAAVERGGCMSILMELDYFDLHFTLTVVYLVIMIVSTALGLFGNIMVSFSLSYIYLQATDRIMEPFEQEQCTIIVLITFELVAYTISPGAKGPNWA
jgi:hypothetical protein